MAWLWQLGFRRRAAHSLIYCGLATAAKSRIKFPLESWEQIHQTEAGVIKCRLGDMILNLFPAMVSDLVARHNCVGVYSETMFHPDCQ